MAISGRLSLMLLVLLLAGAGHGLKKNPLTPDLLQDDVIEEVDPPTLLKMLADEEYLAVFFYTKSCVNCDKVLEELENIDDDADRFGVGLVKICDRPTAKKFGITSFPALVYFRNQQPTLYDGDLMNEEQVLTWLTDLEAMELPDKIEEVNAKILQSLIDESDYVAVVFYKEKCKECDRVLHVLEDIDDDADGLDIGFVKINDQALASEYGLDHLPSLVYYRKEIPLVFDGDLFNGQQVLKWLAEFKDLGEESDVIDDVSANELDAIIDKSDYLAVLFYDADEDEASKILKELEHIDDEAGSKDIDFVKIDDDQVAAKYGIDDLPALVYFERGIPNFYEGDLMNEDEVLEWLEKQKSSDEIEDVSDEALDIVLKRSPNVAVLYYKKDDKKSKQVLTELEEIDDECDKNGIIFLKTDDDEFAQEHDVDAAPTLVLFQNQIPVFYQGDLTKEDDVLEWLVSESTTDAIETVSGKVLQQMIDEVPNLAVLFYDKGTEDDDQVLSELENIDDECDQQDIDFVKIDDDHVAAMFGVDDLPTLVYFEEGIPNFYQGDLSNEKQVLEWLIHQKTSDEIEDVSDRVLERMINKTPYIAVLFYDRESKKSEKVLVELENIDDECDKLGIQFVKIDDEDMASEYGIETMPQLILFENKVPHFFEGDLKTEEQVLTWLTQQMESDEIEDVSEKILEQLIEDSEYLAVLFYDGDDPKSASVIKDLETIDDETDSSGIPLIKIDNDEVAKEFGIFEDMPVLVYFENAIPSIYHGDLKDENSVLGWLLHQKTADEIEDVTDEMLELLIESQTHLIVLFYDENKKSERVLKELENIDDDADKNEMSFVRTDDKEAAEQYGIENFPTLVLFENEIPYLYDGDLMKEEEVLRWLLAQKTSDEIEEVTEQMFHNLVKNTEYLAVLFYDKDSEKSAQVLDDLENIDDDCDKRAIPFVKVDDDSLCKEYGIDDELPVLVYFEDQIPSIYDGDLTDEEEVLEWLIQQHEEDTIEEVTEEILEDLIDDREYILVFFAPDECESCEAILNELENIDDDTDDHGIIFVSTDDIKLAKKKANLENFPSLVLFRNGDPIIYKGQWSKQDLKDWLLPDALYKTSDLIDEEAVLKWVTDENTLDDPEEIDQVNGRMLQKMLSSVFFTGRV